MHVNSANITGFTARGDLGIAPQKAVAKGEEGAKTPVDFRQMMDRSVAKGGQTLNPGRDRITSVNRESEERKNISSFESPKQNTINEQNKNTVNEPKAKETTEAVSDAAKNVDEAVKDTVTSELGITDEQLEEAMEVLGLSYVDLLDPANMQMLMQQVAEDMPVLQTDIFSLSPEEMVGNIENAIASVLTEADLTPEEMGSLLAEMVPADEPVVMESFANILEQAGIPADMLEAGREKPGDMGQMIPQDTYDGKMPAAAIRTTGQEALPEVSVINVVDEEPENIVVNVVTQAETAKEPISGMTQADIASVADDTAAAVADAKIEVPVDGVDALDEDAPDMDVAFTMVQSTDVQEGDSETGFTGNFSGSMADEMAEDAGASEAATFSAEDGFSQVLNGTQTQQPNFAETVAAARQVADAVTTYTQINTTDIMDQIATNAQTTITNEVTRMEMELNPVNLGRMIMQVESNTDGVVTAKLIAQNEAVREALENQLNVLRENLNNRGVRVEAVEVTVGTHEFEQNLEQNARGEDAYSGAEEQSGQQNRERRMRNLNMNDLEGMQGLMSEEEELAARIMRDEGNTLDFQA